MTTSEPTTGEIVRMLREDAAKQESVFHVCDSTMNAKVAADRLESQEQIIAALTARAESAERERDALVKSVDRLVEAWENFKSPALIELVKQWRGLPQDGEGK